MANLLNMQYAFQAQPFLDQAARQNIVLSNMEYAFQAQPFVRDLTIAAKPSQLQINMTHKMVAAGAV